LSDEESNLGGSSHHDNGFVSGSYDPYIGQADLAARPGETASADAHNALLNGMAPHVVQFGCMHALLSRARDIISASQFAEREG